MAFLAAFFILAVSPDGPAIPSADMEEIHDLARLPPSEAYRLEGKTARFRITLDSTDGEFGGFVVYDALAKDDAFGSVWLYPGQVVDDEMIVEAKLVIIHHKAFPGVFDAFTEYRLVRAVRVRP